MSKKNDLPYMPFYVGDWMKAPDIRSLTLAERGLWFDLICYMWESPERGVLNTQNGNKFLPKDVAKMVGAPVRLVKRLLNQIEAKGVFSRLENGAIYCRKMIRDEQIRKIRKISGGKGGNPKLRSNLVNQNPENEIEIEIKALKDKDYKEKGKVGDSGTLPPPEWSVLKNSLKK